MKKVVQTDFASTAFDSSRLNLHTGDVRATRVALFVHGLFGHGYKTWQLYPKFVFEGVDDCDVAIYDYATFHRRVVQRDSSSMSFYVRQLAAGIRELSREYDEVHIVAHSLGGMLAQTAVWEFLEQNLVSGGKPPPMTPIGSIQLLASPRRGSTLAKFGAITCLPEFRWLLRRSKAQAFIAKKFKDRIDDRPLLPRSGSLFWIPRYVVTAGSDLAVDYASASAGVADLHDTPLSESHGSVAKPTTIGDPQLVQFERNLADVRAIRVQFRRQSGHDAGQPTHSVQPTLVTELRTGLNGARWRSVYNSVRSDLTSADLEIRDAQDAKETDPRLVLAIVGTPHLLSKEASSELAVRETLKIRKTGKASAAGISSVGVGDIATAMSRLEQIHVEEGSPINVDLATDDEDSLYRTIAGWLEALISQTPRRTVGTARSTNELEAISHEARVKTEANE